MLFQNVFADHRFGHLLLARQVVRVSESAVVIHRRVDWQTVFAAQIIIIQPMSWRDMDESRASRALNKCIACIKLARPIAKRMLIFGAAQMVFVETSDNFVSLPSAFLRDGREEHSRQNVSLAPDPH